MFSHRKAGQAWNLGDIRYLILASRSRLLWEGGIEIGGRFTGESRCGGIADGYGAEKSANSAMAPCRLAFR